MDKHHHAFRWSGSERPGVDARRNPESATPPILRANWLLKPADMHKGSYDTPQAALSWLAIRLGVDPPARTEMDAYVIEQFAAVKMLVGGDFTSDYRSKRGALVSLALIACPRDGTPCPGRLGEGEKS
jgi:hypothetical protein